MAQIVRCDVCGTESKMNDRDGIYHINSMDAGGHVHGDICGDCMPDELEDSLVYEPLEYPE